MEKEDLDLIDYLNISGINYRKVARFICYDTLADKIAEKIVEKGDFAFDLQVDNLIFEDVVDAKNLGLLIKDNELFIEINGDLVDTSKLNNIEISIDELYGEISFNNKNLKIDGKAKGINLNGFKLATNKIQPFKLETIVDDFKMNQFESSQIVSSNSKGKIETNKLNYDFNDADVNLNIFVGDLDYKNKVYTLLGKSDNLVINSNNLNVILE